MPEVEKTTRTSFKVGDLSILTYPDGDLQLVINGSYTAATLCSQEDRADFTALIRAYLAHIDAEAANA